MITGMIFCQSTGVLRPELRSASNMELIEPNIPPGCSFIHGAYDPLRQRVDIQTMQVVEYRSPELDAIERAETERALQMHRQQILSAMAEVDRKKLRPIGALLLSPSDAVELERLAVLEVELQDLRIRLAELNQTAPAT